MSARFARRAPEWTAAIVFTIATLCGAASAEPPSILTHPLTDIGMIREISKFRSGAGHDFSYDASFPFGATDATEPPSSMKHYLAPLESLSDALGDQETVPVYAPLDGEITRVHDDGTYNIRYDDGDEERYVEARRIKKGGKEKSGFDSEDDGVQRGRPRRGAVRRQVAVVQW